MQARYPHRTESSEAGGKRRLFFPSARCLQWNCEGICFTAVWNLSINSLFLLGFSSWIIMISLKMQSWSTSLYLKKKIKLLAYTVISSCWCWNVHDNHSDLIPTTLPCRFTIETGCNILRMWFLKDASFLRLSKKPIPSVIAISCPTWN